MKLSRLFVVIGLAIALILGCSLDGWSGALPANETEATKLTKTRVEAIALTNTLAQNLAQGTCRLDSTVRANVLNVGFPPPCLEERLQLSQRVREIQAQANASSDLFELQGLRYSLIDGGIRLQGNAVVDSPIISAVPATFSQDVELSADRGILRVKAGRTEVNVSRFNISELQGILRRAVETQLAQYDGKTFYELLRMTEGNKAIAVQSGLSQEAVDFIVQSVQGDISATMDRRGVNLAIAFDS